MHRNGERYRLTDHLGTGGEDLYVIHASDMNDSGQILASLVPRDEVFGDSWTGNGPSYRYLLTPVPEPGTWALMALGLLAVGAVGQHRSVLPEAAWTQRPEAGRIGPDRYPPDSRTPERTATVHP